MAPVSSKRPQRQWVALLILAVLLPTASLLWFMQRVIENERLVVRQKLTALYQDKLVDAGSRTERALTNLATELDRLTADTAPYATFREVVLAKNLQGTVLWDQTGALVYPTRASVLGVARSSDHPLALAWDAEFAQQDYSAAVRFYEVWLDDADPAVAAAAATGKSRCLAKLQRLDEAIAACEVVALQRVETVDSAAHQQALENARLLMLSLLQREGAEQARSRLFGPTVRALVEDLYDPVAGRFIPASRNLFVARKTLSIVRETSEDLGADLVQELETLTAAEALSIAVAEQFEAPEDLPGGMIRLEADGTNVFGLQRATPQGTVLVLLSRERLQGLLSGYHDAFDGSDCVYRILDADGGFIAGTPQAGGEPFTVARLPGGFKGWDVQLFFQGSDVFERAAKRQVAVYLWSGFLVIVMILAMALFASRAVGRQVQLNRMKNDFIATVSHELKTPLASMRVLMDTLLEGRVNDQAQVTRYLQLAAKENERLSRMIDNFLSFSRMERNKNAFTMSDCVPAAIARDAVAAVQTKFEAQGCQFTVTVEDGLPEIEADHDALVTVLINLLDNACKYTGDQKTISLQVRHQTGGVDFVVADNGIGLSSKQVRKIFDRFYQVDNSLARRAEGCGLGLSIVNFIVKAHKGRVTVDSKPGQGSTFTVHLPLGHLHRDDAPARQ